MLAKQLWRIISNPNSILAQAQPMIAKDGHGSLESLNSFHFNQTKRWKDILTVSPIIFDHLQWQVANENNISLNSKFRWKTLNPVPESLQTIKDLTLPNQPQWDTYRLIDLYDFFTVKKILKNPISLFRTNDWMAWTGSTLCSYFVKKGY